ncbi:integrase family protein [uncultured Lamprocystis sp.]|jgi:integrase|uniref:tyrosine-type recombinase/integrase n=1 Tax=uncultured Lamprocystis sp. TaxID=543132 RepID=UPI0025F407DF|nr:integrase family protein [uncultured Lamprocystis sp.]
MSKARLTDSRIAAFIPTQGEWLQDTETHLAVRVRPSGSKTFVFRSALNYRDIRITIGEVGAVALPDARTKAQLWQGWIEDGRDPREVLRQQTADRIAAQVALVTAAQVADREAHRREAPALEAWDAYVAARRPKWGAHMIRDHERVSRAGGAPYTRGPRPTGDDTKQFGILRPLLLLPLAQIDGERVRAWLAEEAVRRPTHAALAFRLLRGFLNWCASHPEFRDMICADACTARSVRDEIPKRRVKDDCLQREQLRAWFTKVRAIPNPVISAFLQTALLVGARREEVAGLRWVDVQFQWNTIHLNDKVDGERVIPLTPYVASLLAALPHRNEWVFSSPAAASGRLQEPSIQHRRAALAAGVEGLTLHGLRRSFATLSEWVEVPVGIVAQIMGHKPSATAEKHYRRRPVDLLRLWHTKIEDWILTEAGIEQPAVGGTVQALRRVS